MSWRSGDIKGSRRRGAAIRIEQLLERTRKPWTIAMVARLVECSYHTAARVLMQLCVERKVSRAIRDSGGMQSHPGFAYTWREDQ
jgi:hypothetical protein